MARNRAKNHLRGLIAELFEELSGQMIAEADQETSFLELGFDSLFLTQVSQGLQSKFAVKINFSPAARRSVDTGRHSRTILMHNSRSECLRAQLHLKRLRWVRQRQISQVQTQPPYAAQVRGTTAGCRHQSSCS
jgi:acyl carrier protein